MKNFYDKVLFLLGLVLVGLGVFVFLKSGGAAHSSSSGVKGSLTGQPYETLAMSTFATPVVEWSVDKEQTPEADVPEGRVFGVFTPPKAWFDQGEWRFEPPIPAIQLPPFGLHWVGLKQEPYRIQLTGTVKGKPGDEIAFTFTDTEDGNVNLFNAKKGETEKSTPVNSGLRAAQIKVTDYAEDSTPDDRGMVDTKYKVTILDLKTGETIELTKGVPVTIPGHEFILFQTEDPFPPQPWRITRDKSTQKLVIDGAEGSTTFTASDLKLSLDNPSVKVTKEFHFDRKSVTKIKTFPESPDSSSATPSPPTPVPAK